MPRWLKWLKQLINPKVFIPLVVIVGVVALLFSFGNPKKILGTMESFNREALLWVFVSILVYEFVRFWQWLYLLRHEGIKVPVRAQIFSFAGGEATRFFPVGNYFQNYLLTTAEGIDFAFSSAVSTMIILLEVVISLLGVMILGLGEFSWVRWVILGGLILAGVAIWLLRKHHGNLDPPDWVHRHQRLDQTWARMADELRQFAKGSKRLLRWRTIAISLLLAAAYLLVGAVTLYIVLAGLGWQKTSFADVLAVYFFSLAVGLIFPLPVDVGVTELSGVGAFLAVGVDRNLAISAMLVNRVLTILSSVVIALAISAIFHGELRRALQSRGTQENEQATGDKTSEEGARNTSQDTSQDASHAAPTL